jgi:hypothetical protein
MYTFNLTLHRALRGAVIVALAALLAGCAAADKTATATSTSASGSAGSSGSSGSSAGSSAGSSSGMAGMNGASTAVAGMTVNGVHAVPSQVLAAATWQGMKVQARTMTAAPFVIYNGTSETLVKPPKNVSFHLMIMLNDAHTGVPIPYAGVWVTITENGKIVYDERQWPMLSAFMGPHYGNNVVLPGAGTYQLKLLISPPVSARHVEYMNVWLHPHVITESFHWTPTP